MVNGDYILLYGGEQTVYISSYGHLYTISFSIIHFIRKSVTREHTASLRILLSDIPIRVYIFFPPCNNYSGSCYTFLTREIYTLYYYIIYIGTRMINFCRNLCSQFLNTLLYGCDKLEAKAEEKRVSVQHYLCFFTYIFKF